jgi:hypothetical protein
LDEKVAAVAHRRLDGLGHLHLAGPFHTADGRDGGSQHPS